MDCAQPGVRNKGIVNDPIVLTVYATGAPDLTLIDLPLGPTGDGVERICGLCKAMSKFDMDSWSMMYTPEN